MIWIAYDPMTKSTNNCRRDNTKDCIAIDKDEPRVHSTAQHILYLLENSIDMDNDLRKAA